jgi:hypothetical protein
MPRQVADGLHFLHTEANQVHRALCPHTVFITTMGAWKLGGLSLSCPSFITPETAGVIPVSYRDPSMERFMRYQQVPVLLFGACCQFPYSFIPARELLAHMQGRRTVRWRRLPKLAL